VAADRRLGHVQDISGTVVRAEADDGQERAQMGGIEIHVGMVTPSVLFAN
jgi:hypothetical protein